MNSDSDDSENEVPSEHDLPTRPITNFDGDIVCLQEGDVGGGDGDLGGGEGDLGGGEGDLGGGDGDLGGALAAESDVCSSICRSLSALINL